MLAGAIALTVAAPLVVTAQSNQPNQPVPGQQTPKRGRFRGIELTPQQQEQFAQLRRDTRAQMQNVLTPEQQQQFKAAMQNGQNRRTAFAAMNLSEQQKTQLQAIMQSAKSRSEAILTPEQRQQIQQKAKQWRQQRQQ